MGEGGRYTQKRRQYICHPYCRRRCTARQQRFKCKQRHCWTGQQQRQSGGGGDGGGRSGGGGEGRRGECLGSGGDCGRESPTLRCRRMGVWGVWGASCGSRMLTGDRGGFWRWRRRFSYHPLHPLTPNSPQVWPAPLPAESPGILLPGYPPPHLRPHPILSPTPHLSGLASTSSGGFSSLGGVSDHAAALRQLVTLPLRAPHLFAAYRIRPPRGVLLWGPPGSGT